MASILWLMISPVIFVLPGLYPARLVTGHLYCVKTLTLAAFFSILLLPPIAFGIAMMLGTTMNGWVVIPLALALGIPGLFFPRNK